MSFEEFIPYEKERRKRYRVKIAKQKAETQKLAEEKIRINKLKSEYVKSIDTLNVYNFYCKFH